MPLGRFVRIGDSGLRVELDRKALFALASDTRLDILKSLQPMRRTLVQVAAAIGIDRAAVFRHLKMLEEGGLVKRYEDHGFVYYGLSWRARDILSPGDNTRITLLLTVYALLLTVAISACWVILQGEYADPLYPPKSGDIPYDPSESILAVLSFCAASSLAVSITFWASIRLLRKTKQSIDQGDRAKQNEDNSS